MTVDEELLKPSRDHLAYLGAQIKALEAETAQKIKRYGADDKDYAKAKWSEFYRATEPLRREQDAVVKLIANYYGWQAMPTIHTPPGFRFPFPERSSKHNQRGS